MLRVDELYLKKAFDEIHTEYAKQAMNIMKQHPGRGNIKTDTEFDLQAYKEIFTILYIGKMTRKEIIKDLKINAKEGVGGGLKSALCPSPLLGNLYSELKSLK